MTPMTISESKNSVRQIHRDSGSNGQRGFIALRHSPAHEESTELGERQSKAKGSLSSTDDGLLNRKSDSEFSPVASTMSVDEVTSRESGTSDSMRRITANSDQDRKMTYRGRIEACVCETAYVHLTDPDGIEFSGRYPMSEFDRLGLKEGDYFDVTTEEVDGEVKVSIQPPTIREVDLAAMEQRHNAFDQQFPAE